MEVGRLEETVVGLVKGHDPVGLNLWMKEHFQLRGERDLESEKNLMLALLESEVRLYQKYVKAKSRKERELFQTAEEWILERDSDWLYSFENVCESMGFNPDYVRKGLIKWKEKELTNALPTNRKRKYDSVR